VALVFAAAWHLAVFLALAAAVMTPIEWMAGARRSRWRRAPVAIALTAAGAMLTVAVSTWLAPHAPALYDPGRAPDWPRFLGLVVSAEVAAYAVHRAMHGHRWLWRFHRVHHAPGPIFWLDAWRMHPVDAGLHLATGTALALLWDVPLAAHAPGLLLRKLYTGFLHAAGDWRPTFLDRVIATPAFHHRHHDGIRGNYAGMLSVLDLVLGTWNAGDRRPAAQPRLRGRGWYSGDGTWTATSCPLARSRSMTVGARAHSQVVTLAKHTPASDHAPPA
jgi:sterol desaturase/sphingolipid hydroxylase (fatty acid hydroxylase superfamily)